MKLPPLIYNTLGKFFLFAALITIGVMLTANNRIVQRYKIMENIRRFQSFFWEKHTALRNYTSLREINTSLIEQNALLLRQTMAYRNYITQHMGEAKLKELSTQIENKVGDTTLINADLILAKVIRNSTRTEHNYLILDKGSLDGITEDLGVITPYGAVGITRATGPHYTYVSSFLNEKQAISARIGNSQSFGSLRWNSKAPQTATLFEIPLSVKVEKGDMIYTSGYSSFFPPNIPVGKVISYETSTGTHKDVKVRLLQDFKTLDYVIVVKNHNTQEIDSLSRLKTILN